MIEFIVKSRMLLSNEHAIDNNQILIKLVSSIKVLEVFPGLFNFLGVQFQHQ